MASPMQFSSPHAPGSEMWCEHLSKFIGDAVEADSIEEYREPAPGRWHLGASEIGNPCSRAIWYSFRWARKVEHPGWLHRLFKRGHKEEPNFVHRLARVGIYASDRDPVTGKQYQIEHPYEPHFGGSLDGIAYVPWLPEGFQYMLTEFKTHNANSFEKLVTKGVRVSKPQHYHQQNCYGKIKGLKYGLYCALSKNDDKLYFRVVPLDWKSAEMIEKKAHDIIRSPTPPRRISENSADSKCKMCDYRGPCHLGQPMHVNCRSCVHASPNPNDREWTCAKYGGPIPRETVVTGCRDHVPLS